jgi:CubicO group peptidase (beta-lactamase class C family)
MTFAWTDDATEVRLDVERFEAALRLVRGWCEAGEIPAAAVAVGRPGVILRPRVFGRLRSGEDVPLPADAIFTVASITKPVVAMGVLLLVERGLVALGDRVADLVPEFGGKGRYGVRLRHLLTHTSGLPDLLPQDRELRKANAPLSEFLAGVCETEPLFAAGRGVSYASCGFVLLGEIVARVTGLPLPEFLRREVFVPLGMSDTALGAPPEWFSGPEPKAARLASVQVPEEQAGGDLWNWNSRYWRTLGAPWGGLLSTAADLAVFAHAMLSGRRPGGRSIFSEAAVAAATANQLAPMREVPEADRRCRPWGYGWRLNWPAHGAYFGDLLGPAAYGHWGATGTLLWVDPGRDAFAVLLTTRPQDPDGRWLARLSNAVAASLL